METREYHDDGMHQVGAIRQPTQRLQHAEREGRVDAAAVARAASNDYPCQGGAPGSVAHRHVQS